jgi:WXG100 family type VII secretion target
MTLEAVSVEVDVTDLVASGVAVTACGEDLAAGHAAADSRIDAASASWRGQSAAALGALADRWAASTEALLTRLRDHAAALHASAAGFTEHEQRAAAALG